MLTDDIMLYLVLQSRTVVLVSYGSLFALHFYDDFTCGLVWEISTADERKKCRRYSRKTHDRTELRIRMVAIQQESTRGGCEGDMLLSRISAKKIILRRRALDCGRQTTSEVQAVVRMM